MDTRDWDQELIEEQESLEADPIVKEVAIILRTREESGTPWLDWDVWEEQSNDDERLDALRTAAVVIEHMRADLSKNTTNEKEKMPETRAL